MSNAPQRKYVPALATVSLCEVMDLFEMAPDPSSGQLNGGYSHLITHLKARGSQSDGGGPDREDDVLGVKAWLASSGSRFQLDYQLSFDDDGFPENPLNEDRIRSIHRYLESAALNDAAVTEMSVLFYDEELSHRVGVRDNRWRVTLQSDQAVSRQERAEVDAHRENVPLIEEEGFKYRILNCRKLIDRRQELMEVPANQDPQFIWKGQSFDGLYNGISDDIKLLNHHHMGKYGFGKWYRKDREDSLVLMGVDSSPESETETETGATVVGGE